MPHTIYLSIGSNLGDRLANLNKAIAALSPKVTTLLRSSVYETEPWGYTEQPSFYNLVLKAESDLSPQELLNYLKAIESSMGRKETFRFGPRLIDLDILLYDDLVLDTDQLTIPHLRMAERAFVLVPLAEIAPDLRHPTLGETISALKSAIDPGSLKPQQAATSR